MALQWVRRQRKTAPGGIRVPGAVTSMLPLLNVHGYCWQGNNPSQVGKISLVAKAAYIPFDSSVPGHQGCCAREANGAVRRNQGSTKPFAFHGYWRVSSSACSHGEECSLERSSSSLLTRTFLWALVCTDDARSWESREACGPHLLRFQLGEPGVRDQGSQVVQAASPGVKARRLARSVLLAREIGNDQAPPWFEHPGDFRESLTFEARRQMMHHQGREHHIERLIGEGELLDHPDLKIDRQVAPSRFRVGTGDLLLTGVNACDAARLAYVALRFQRQCSRAAAHIQHRLSGV